MRLLSVSSTSNTFCPREWDHSMAPVHRWIYTARSRRARRMPLRPELADPRVHQEPPR